MSLATMFGSNKDEWEQIPKTEWNFLDVPESDKEICFLYELAREVEHPEAYFSGYLSRQNVPFGIAPLTITPQEESAASSDFKEKKLTLYMRSADLPDEEQDLESHEILAGLYFLHPDGSLRAYPAELKETPWVELDEALQANLQAYAEEHLSGVTFHETRDLMNWDVKEDHEAETLPDTERWRVCKVKIDWHKDDPSIIEGFANWLRRQRPKSSSAKSWLGRQSPDDKLKTLSALRLRHILSIEDATKYTRWACGSPLYQDRSSWDRAQRRAVLAFNSAFPSAGAPRSESRVSNRKA